MTREQWLEKGFTEEQVTEILNEFHGQNQVNANLLNEVNNLKQVQTKYDNVQRELDDIKKANMSKEDQLALREKEIEMREKAAAQKAMETNRLYNTAKVKGILAGYDIDDELINRLVSDDETSSIASANLFKSKLDNLAEATAKKAKEEISNLNVKPTASNVPNEGVMTWEKFSSMSVEEQNAFQMEHPNEFANL